MAKTKTSQKKSAQKTMSVKKEIRRKRSTKKKELEKEADKGAIQLGRKRIFKDGEELLELFNLYLASIQIKTVNDLWEEQWNFKEFPSKLRFYVFLWGMSRESRSEYKTRTEFSDTIQFIEDFFESELEIRWLDWRHSASMTQFVLNTTYWRNPKNLNDENKEVKISFTA